MQFYAKDYQNKKPKKPLPKHFNILSLDGDVDLDLVHRLDKENPKFLRDTDLITCTSSNVNTVLELIDKEGALKLEEFRKKIVIVSFIGDQPKFISNFGENNPDRDIKISKVRTLATAEPVVLKNPSIAAITQVLADKKMEIQLGHICLLSVGVGVKNISHIECKAFLKRKYRRVSPAVSNITPTIEWLKKNWI